MTKPKTKKPPPTKPLTRAAIRRALLTPGYVMLQFHERHDIPLRTIWRMRDRTPEHPPTLRTLRRFTDAIDKDRQAGLLK